MKQRRVTTGPTAGHGRLRIIAGRWRGRKLPVLDLPGLRPTPDRVRETLFNWLAPDIRELSCLDLFAGTGALGFEALSRGAAHAVMLESHAQAVVQLRKNATLLQADAEIIQADALSSLAKESRRFDLVFVDPPFQAELWDRVLALLPARLNAGHRVYVEAPAAWPGPSDPAWRVLKQGKAADVVFRLLDYSGPLHAAQHLGDLQ
jgi:16S rRNA (guanine966-N2)-methyltransferase